MIAAVNWTTIIVALIAGIPAIISAIFAGKVHNQIKTPSGKSLGEVAEYSHDTAIANNMLLSKKNGPTKDMEHDTVINETPQMPDH